VTYQIAADHRCMFGTAGHYCGARASIHVLQKDGSPTLGCTEHAGWWTYHSHEDNHPVRPDCGMPGTYWMHSTPEAVGFCFVGVPDA
jgi:hypothetical protein